LRIYPKSRAVSALSFASLKSEGFIFQPFLPVFQVYSLSSLYFSLLKKARQLGAFENYAFTMSKIPTNFSGTSD
jgi:hypothetical protein